MKDESAITQRRLVGKRLRMGDVELHAKYAFPFIDREWASPFVVLDVFGMGPRVFHGPLDLTRDGMHTAVSPADLQRIETVPVETFEGLVHYDPWWVFRGVAGVERDWVKAVVATNIAHPFEREGKKFKIHDLALTAGLRGLTAVVAKDDIFHQVDFHKGEIDLFGLRKPQKR